MKRTHVSSEISRIMKRARGRYGVAIGQLVKSHKIEMPLVGLKSIPAPLYCEEKDFLPVEYKEVLCLLEPITRLGRSVADIVGLAGKIIYIDPLKNDILVPVGTDDRSRLVQDGRCSSYQYRIPVDAGGEDYRQAVCLVTAIRCVKDVQYVSTRKGDIYIRCTINNVRKEAVRMGRVDARSIEQFDPEQEMHMAGKYFQEDLLKAAERLKFGKDGRF